MKTTYNDNVLKILRSYIDGIISRISKKDKNNELSLNDFLVINSDDYQISELVNDGKSGEFNILVSVKVTDKNGESHIISNELQIPRQINDLFVINGKYRVAINKLTNSGICRMYRRDQKISHFILDYNRKFSFRPEDPFGSLVIKCYDDDSELITASGLEGLEQVADYMKLTADQISILKIKLDVDEIPDSINKDLIEMIFNLPDDRDRDLIVDKTITSVESDFQRFLYSPDNRRFILNTISSKWWKYGGLYLSSIETIINRYFNGSKSKFIEIPNNINPLVYDSLRYKLISPRSIPYNKSFADIIDPTNTPENGNVNKNNELNSCVSIKNGSIYIDCIDAASNRSGSIKYLDYVDSPVLVSKYYDYENKEIVPSSEYEYKYHFKTLTTKDLSVIKYIEPAPDDRLSNTVRRIPLVNMCDSVRISMGAGMIKQSIEIEGAEPRRISSGHDGDDIKKSVSVIKFEEDHGVIKSIDNSRIIIMIDEFPYQVDIPSPSIGANNSVTSYECKRKVGDKIKKGDVLIAPSTLIQDNYSLGLNANTVYLNYLGFTYEDGIVISESYSKRCTHYSILRGTRKIKVSDLIGNIVPIGTKLSINEPIATIRSLISARSSLLTALDHDKDAANILNPKRRANDLVSPNNLNDGYLVDIQFIPNPDRSGKMDNDTLMILEGASSNTVDYDIPQKYKQLKASAPKIKFNDDDAGALSFVIVKVNPMKIGDKSCNSYGSKGIISLVLPDDLMPRIGADDEGNGGTPAEIIMNPAAVISRKNISQLYEINLNNCINKIYEKVGDYLVDEDFNSIRSLLKKYYGNKYESNTDAEINNLYLSGINNFSMNVGCYSKIDYNTMMEWMRDLGVEEGDYAYIPDVVIYESDGGTKACTPEYAQSNNISGKLYEMGFTEQPVITGLSYMYKLYHSADYVGKVTNDLITKNEPLLGKGLFRDTGQKIGEMELWALMSKGLTEMVTRNDRMMKDDENTFLQELLLTGLVMTDSNNLPLNHINR